MCGIFGAVGPTAERLGQGVVDRVSASLAHRGPDSEGRHLERECVLLHRRLRIIDLSEQAAQPMSNEDGTIWVVFNGEIYGHHQLREELLTAGHVFRSRSDTEVIVHGYEQWGDGVVERLDGMFAFGLWDAPRRRLLLGRDRAGKKPLYYSRAGGLFRFASEVKALHASGVSTGLGLDALPQYLTYGFVPPPATLHLGVGQLPPACKMVVESGRLGSEEAVPYWRPHFGTRGPAPSFGEAAREVRRLVVSAVERRLEADVPLGAFLSGGIDSSIIVGVMSRALGSGVRTFSIGFAGDARYDETHYARLAARAFGTTHTEFTLEPSSFELVEKLVWHHDGPFGDSSAIPTYVVSGLTRQHVTVALSGDGGDELFCGYVRFLAAEAAERLPLSLRRLGAALATRLSGAGSRAGVGTGAASERSLLGRARRFMSASALPLDERMARWNTFFPDLRALLKPEVAERLAERSALAAPLEWQRAVFAECQGDSVLSRVLEHNFRTYLPFDLMVKADRTSMAHGLELRSPFLDLALMEYAFALPPAYVRRGRETKRVLKYAFRDLLPDPIQRRGKMGFGVPLGTWFRGDLQALLHDHLGSGARLYEYLDARAVARLLEEHGQGLADHGQRLWALLTLEIWLRTLRAEARLPLPSTIEAAVEAGEANRPRPEKALA